MQVGLVVMDENPADALKIVRAAERAGIHSLWTIDYYNRSSLTRAAAFAAVSETAIVGTSVTPLFARAPLALAAAAADVQGIAGGRFVLGAWVDVIDWAILYPPHFGVEPERIHANELGLIEVASGWTSLPTPPKRVRIVTFDVIDPGQQGLEILGHAEVTTGQPVRAAAGQREDEAGRLLRVGAAAGGELVAYPAVDTAFWRLLTGSAPQRDLAETDGQQAGVHAEH